MEIKEGDRLKFIINSPILYGFNLFKRYKVDKLMDAGKFTLYYINDFYFNNDINNHYYIWKYFENPIKEIRLAKLNQITDVKSR